MLKVLISFTLYQHHQCRVPQTLILEELRELGIDISAGQFLMGSPDSDRDARDFEKPQHQVKINSFAIGKYPVTQAQYQAVMGR